MLIWTVLRTAPWRAFFALAVLLTLSTGCGMRRTSQISGAIPTWPTSRAAKNEGRFRIVDPNSLARADAMPVQDTLGEWRNMGPPNYGGKVYSIAIHPTDPNVVFVAYGNAAGVWRTRNGGQSWVAVTDRFRNPSTVSVAISAADQAVYVALGGEQSSYNRDGGVLRSRDGGETFTAIGPRAKAVWQVVPHPSNRDTVYAAARDGVFKTTDGGATWNSVLAWTDRTGFDWMPDLKLQPGTPETMLVAQAEVGVMRSEDGGRTWAAVDQSMDQTTRTTVLAWSVSDPNTVYAERVRTRDVADAAMLTYRSTDAGRTWTVRTTVTRFHQSRYDMSMAVSPSDPNLVVIANTFINRSTDGLATTTELTTSLVDYSAVEFAPSNPSIMYAGADQGVTKSVDGGRTWSGRAADRFDDGVETDGADGGVAVDPVSQRVFLSARDYGSTIDFAIDRRAVDIPGFGFEYTMVHLHPLDRNLVFAAGEARSFQRLNLQTGVIGGTDPDVVNGRARSDFKSAVAFHPTNPSIMYYGTRTVWRSTNTGDTWTNLTLPNPTAEVVKAIAVAATNPQILYALTPTALVRSTNEGGSWTRVVEGAVFSGGTSLALDPTNPNHVWVGAREGLFESTDGGTTLQPRGQQELPNASVNDVVLDPTLADRVLLGTDLGVYISENRGATWQRLGSGMPILNIQTLRLAGRKLYAGTFQGVWMMDLNGAKGCALPSYAIGGPLRFTEQGGELTVSVAASETCSWNLTPRSGLRFTTFEKTRGNGKLKIIVDPNPGTQRDLAFTIGGTSIPAVQFERGSSIAVDGASTRFSDPTGTRCIAIDAQTGGFGEYIPRMAACDNSNRQLFRIKAAAGGGFNLTPADFANYCMDLFAFGTSAGTPVNFFPCDDRSNKQFDLRQIGNRLWQIAARGTGQCVSVADTGLLVLASCDESRAERTFQVPAPAATGGVPVLAVGGTINGASFRAPVAPGMIAAVFGERLGSSLAFASSVPLPTTLAGVSLSFSGNLAVPIFFAAPGQMNIQIPWELAGQTSATLTATTVGGASAGIPVTIAPAAPAIFSTNQQGTGQGVVLIASSGEIAAPTGSIQGRAHRPANAGEFLTIYCLGLGDVDNRPATGNISPSAEPLGRVRVVPTVTIGGVNAEVTFAGLAPGFVGLYQINVRIPDDAPAGDAVNLVITTSGVASNTVTIAVQ